MTIKIYTKHIFVSFQFQKFEQEEFLGASRLSLVVWKAQGSFLYVHVLWKL